MMKSTLTEEMLEDALLQSDWVSLYDEKNNEVMRFNSWEAIEALKRVAISLAEMAYPQTPFIHGHGGNVDEMGFPDILMICNAYGSDVTAVYRKASEPSSPGW